MKIKHISLLFSTNDQVIIDKEIIKCCSFYDVTSTFIFIESTGELKGSQACREFVLSFKPNTTHIHYGKGYSEKSRIQKLDASSKEGLTRVAFGTDLSFVLVVYEDDSEHLLQVPSQANGGLLDIKINTDNVYIHGHIQDLDD